MTYRFHCGLLAGLLLVFAGCAYQPPVVRPPVEERGSQPPADSRIEPVPVPRQPTVERLPGTPRSPAITSLLAKADTEVQQGRLENASALLERALRIDGRDAGLWYRLAQIRYQQGDYSQAVQLAKRANDHAYNDRAQLRLNWQLLARIHAARGDEMSLVEAQRKLRELQ